MYRQTYDKFVFRQVNTLYCKSVYYNISMHHYNIFVGKTVVMPQITQ